MASQEAMRAEWEALNKTTAPVQEQTVPSEQTEPKPEIEETSAEETPEADQGKEMAKGYMPMLIKAVEHGKKALPSQNFFVVMSRKSERVFFQRVIRLLPPIVRHSCPTPNYDQDL